MSLMAASRGRARALTVTSGNCNSADAIGTRREVACSIHHRRVPRINQTTRELLGSVSLGVLLALGSNGAWAQSAPTLYVTNQGNGTVSVISTSTDTITSTITGLSEPWGAAVRGDQSLLYAVSLNGGGSPGFVSVIDTATNTTVGANIQVGLGPTAIALTPNGKTAYVTNENSNTVSAINTATNTVVTIPVGINPFLVAISPNGATAYVANNSFSSPSNGSVSVINTATNTVIATIALGSNDPAGLTVTPDGSKLYVTNTGNVTVINTATNTIASTIPIANSVAVVVSPNGAKAYVLSGTSVSVINTATNTVTNTIALGAGASVVQLAISPDGTALYVTENNNNRVVVINTATNTIASTITIPAGSLPLYPAICANGNALLATGLTFKANTSGALGCTLASGAAGASGPVFTGGTLQFAGAGISSSLPITLMSQGGTFDTAGNNATLSGAIGGSGGLTKIGAGTLTLSGAGTYSGPTNVNAGTLQAGAANAFSPNSAYAIASGGALDLHGFSQVIGGLSGTGAVVNSGGVVPTLTIANGGIFAPGNGAPGSSMAIAANLAFQSGAIYLVQVNSSTASFATISGTAKLSGATVNANFAGGTYIAKQYTLLQSAGLNGATFSGLSNTGLPAGFTDSLSYTSTAVFLNLTANVGGGGGLNGNQQNAANGINTFFNGGGPLPAGFLNLFNLSGAPLANALSQISGETATGSQQTTFNAMGQFMGLMTDPFMSRSDRANPASGASGYADEASAYAANKKTDAFAMFTKAPPAAPFEQRWSVWAAGFGGSQTTSGNAVVGSNNTTSSIAGTAAGADYLISPNTIAGFALAGGATAFSVANGGAGRSDLFQVGAYVRHNQGPAYISAALAYGWQDITTNRTVTVAGLDQLRAEFNANAWSGRLEGGYRFVSPVTFGIGITPYAAAQFVTFDLPAYAEQAVVGTNNFALANNAKDVSDARTELGIRTDKSWAVIDGILTLRGRFAWAHDYDPDRSIGATFQSLPGASFVVNGAAQSADSALATASIEMKWKNNWSVAATFEGEFSNVTSSYAGKGLVRYAW